MAEYLIQDTTLTAIADAIRGKSGSTEAFMAAIEKRKAEIAANKAEKSTHEAVKQNNETFTKLIERLKAVKEAAKETAE